MKEALIAGMALTAIVLSSCNPSDKKPKCQLASIESRSSKTEFEYDQKGILVGSKSESKAGYVSLEKYSYEPGLISVMMSSGSAKRMSQYELQIKIKINDEGKPVELYLSPDFSRSVSSFHYSNGQLNYCIDRIQNISGDSVAYLFDGSDNVVESRRFKSDGKGGYVTEFTSEAVKYDNNENPFNGFMGFFLSQDINVVRFFSKNNVVSSKLTRSNWSGAENILNYTYDANGFPTAFDIDGTIKLKYICGEITTEPNIKDGKLKTTDWNGTYKNKSDGVLVIDNFKAGESFNFKLTVGGTSSCAGLEISGTSQLTSETKSIAKAYEDDTSPSTIELIAGKVIFQPSCCNGQVGMECLKFFDSEFRKNN